MSVLKAENERLKGETASYKHHVYNLLNRLTKNAYGPFDPPRNYITPAWVSELEQSVDTAIQENERLKARIAELESPGRGEHDGNV